MYLAHRSKPKQNEVYLFYFFLRVVANRLDETLIGEYCF